MNTSFGGNQVGNFQSLDIAGSYPTGLLAGLGPLYNNSQELINAQLRYTASQVNITAAQDSQYMNTDISIQQTATISPISLNTQIAAINYKNAASHVNYANMNIANIANIAYANANAVTKVCEDASYSAYLTHEASQIVLNRISTAVIVWSLAKYTPDVNPIDYTTLSSISTSAGMVGQDAQDAITLAQTNAFQYLLKTQDILGNAITKATSVATNLTLVAAFNNLVKCVAKTIIDPLSEIAGKELLVTQYVPHVPLQNAINISNGALSSMNVFVSSIAMHNNLSTISTLTATAGTLANSLDAAARITDIKRDLTNAIMKHSIAITSTIRGGGAPISTPDYYTFTPERVSETTIGYLNYGPGGTASTYSTIVGENSLTSTVTLLPQSTIKFISAVDLEDITKKISLSADTSANNARAVSDALLAVQAAFIQTISPQPIITTVANASKNAIISIMSTVKKVTSNSSSWSAVNITRRANNTIVGDYESITEKYNDSIDAANDATEVVQLLIKALMSTTVTDINVTEQSLWLTNAAKGKAEEISKNAKDKAYILSRTAHNYITPAHIATQTYSAATLGASNVNKISRLARISDAPPVISPKPYSSYKADIRAKRLLPVRPTLNELVYRNRLQPLRLDSLRSIIDTKVKVAQEVQYIHDISAFSFRQQ